ncbi:MAG: glycosyltransferase family 4 protein [Gemmatimonadota bacterium]
MTKPSAPSSPAGDAPLGVACLSVSAALGGSEWVLFDFASRARAHGIEPLVVLPKPGPLNDALKQAGVPHTVAAAPDDFLELSQRTMLSAEGMLRFGRGVWRWSRAIGAELDRLSTLPAGRPTVLLSNGFKAHLAASLLRGYRRVWHLHEFPPGRLDAVWKALAGAIPDATIAVSHSVADAWRMPRFPAPRVALNGVDTERFQPALRTHWIHDQLRLPHDARLIGMPAVFARWKGHLLVVEAFERIAAELPEAHLVLVGGPIYDTAAERGYGEELVRRVRRSSLPGPVTAQPLHDRIHFLKFQSEPWRLYPEFDLVVHFSTRPEPFGRVIVEAMASGVPVIAADAGGPREIVEHGVTGWLIPPGDVAALGEQLVAALRTDTRAMGQAARRAAQDRFAADRFARDVAGVLHGIADWPRRRRGT